ncbi:MAG: hypothetical protein DWQ31_07655 [Planctomycetota bacterium]|nr:MAG: hypothetical protein DWQ31_07655 [Planctomycetota bacterium]REJ89574.1 MAG: hypothetical protein DWQ35_17965 [Planctomycetota bacterium]REK31437.1 MAG: hypothetical protein DWQ42_00475 [Planctomycetota bacterium]REK40667.1 MAG: hypothetical protein DWQ46_15615 [Planctomycetota bacterium]
MANPGSMFDLFESPRSLAIVSLAAIALLIAAGAYVLSRFRDVSGDDRLTANELLSNFREMHSRGELSEEEFRTIKAKLARQLEEELRATEQED